MYSEKRIAIRRAHHRDAFVAFRRARTQLLAVAGREDVEFLRALATFAKTARALDRVETLHALEDHFTKEP